MMQQTELNGFMNIMKWIKTALLALCLGLTFAPQSGHGVVPGDTNTLQGAVFLATNNVYPPKTILLVISATNACSACVSLDSTGLPSTNPPVFQFLRESFVYWPCGPDENCTAYQQWLGTGTIPVPELLMIDPANTSTYFAISVGFGGASTLLNEMRVELQRGTAPYVTGLEEANSPGNGINITAANWKNTNTVSFSNIVVQCHSISTNVPLYYVRYKLDTTNGWSSLTISNQTAWATSLNPAQIVPGINVLRFYAMDINGNGTRTNVFTFSYNANGVVQTPTTTALSLSANPTTYGNSVTLTAIVTPSAATGSVTFEDGASVLGTSPLSSGSATYTTDQLSVGSHSLSAMYLGNSSYSASTGTTNLTVNQASPPNLLAELNQAFTNYWNANTNVTMTNPVALCNGFFQFSLSNISGLNLKVQVSTDLTTWTVLTNAAPVYQFQDPGATGPWRYYRLAP